MISFRSEGRRLANIMDMGLSIVSCGEYQVTLWLHTDKDPPDELWEEALERTRELKKQLSGDISKVLTLAVTDGGAPNTMQRRQLFSEVLEGEAKSAVVTTVLTNRIKRGVATAIFWLNPNFSAFGPHQFDEALAHLNLQDHRTKLIAELERLQQDLPPNETLQKILS